MLADEVVAEVRRLVAEGQLSQRQIAARVGVSRGTVLAIAAGRRVDRPSPLPEDDASPHGGPFVRCPGCGGRVRMPCRLCRLRARLLAP